MNKCLQNSNYNFTKTEKKNAQNRRKIKEESLEHVQTDK